MGNCLSCVYGCYDRDLIIATQGRDFSFKGKTFKAKVVSVYDGDTITVIFRHLGYLEQHKVRLYGIDTPELKPRKDIKDRDTIIQKAEEARNMLSKMILNKIIFLECENFDKYGRILGTIYIKQEGYLPCRGKINVNTFLLNSGYAVAYDGRTKISKNKIL